MQILVNSYFSGAGLCDLGLSEAGLMREYARLQGVPDGFVFCGGDRAAFRQIGNGVSVPVARWVGTELKRYFKAA